MIDLYSQIIQTWQTNNNINLMLLEGLKNEMLDYTLAPRGGSKIGHQLAHMYNVRYWKLEKANKSLIKNYNTIKSSDQKTTTLLKQNLIDTGAMIQEVIAESLENDGQVKGFKRGIVPFIGYFISHEAHHRGNILLTLKIKGIKLPEDLKYGIWEWNKI